MANKRNRIEYSLVLRGIFGRNRKPKFETFDGWAPDADPAAPTPLEVLLPLARAKLAELRPKPGCQIRIDAIPVELTDEDYGDRVVTIKSVLLSRLVDSTLHREIAA